MNYTDHIKKFLNEIGGEEVKDVVADKQDVIGFKYTINKKKTNIAIFHGVYDDRIILQVYCSLPHAFKEPGKNLYAIIEKLNVSSMLGYLFFAESNGSYFISYKSNLIHDKNSENYKNIEFFITTSIQMISVNHSELNIT